MYSKRTYQNQKILFKALNGVTGESASHLYLVILAGIPELSFPLDSEEGRYYIVRC